VLAASVAVTHIRRRPHCAWYVGTVVLLMACTPAASDAVNEDAVAAVHDTTATRSSATAALPAVSPSVPIANALTADTALDISSAVTPLLAMAADTRAPGGASPPQHSPDLLRVYQEFQVEEPVDVIHAATVSYPVPLKARGIGGRVLVQFVVDTLGTAEMSSFRVLASPDSQLTKAVESVLPRWRFRPARVGAQAVRQVVHLPFDFR
jgi:TonB family protein